METIKCPSCRRVLKLPEGLRGTDVQCPSCHTSFVPPRFQEPSETIALVPESRAVPVPSEATAPRAAEPLHFNRERESRYFRGRRKVDAAAAWLRRAVVCDLLATMICCPCSLIAGLPQAWRGGEPIVFGLMALLVVIMILNMLVLIGSHYLVRRRLYGLVMAAAIAVFPLALKNVLQTAFLLVNLLSIRFKLDACLNLSILVIVGLSTGATFNGVVGGLKTLYVLNDPEMRRDFR